MPATETDSSPPWEVLTEPPEGVPSAAVHLRPAKRGHLWFRQGAGSAALVWLAPYDGSPARRATDADYDLAPETAPTDTNGPRAQKGAPMSATTTTTTTTEPPKSRKASPTAQIVENGTDAELRAYLLERPTIADVQWQARQGRKRRRDGESRSEFIERVLGDGS